MKRNKEPEPDSPRQRLVNAAIEQLEKLGMARLTVRDVAAAAGANIAAVNYHFGSKEALVEAALEGAVRHLLEDVRAGLSRTDLDPRARLQQLLSYLLEGSLRFPRLSKAQLHAAFSGEDYSGPFFRMFAPVLGQVRDLARSEVPGLSESVATRRTIATLSAVLFPALFSGMFAPLAVLESPRQRRAYVDALVEQLLSEATPAAQRRKQRS